MTKLGKISHRHRAGALSELTVKLWPAPILTTSNTRPYSDTHIADVTPAKHEQHGALGYLCAY